jgi:hypothetical protein
VRVKHPRCRGVPRAVVREPLNRMWRLEYRLAEARPQRAVHQGADVGARQRPRGGDEGGNFPIVAVDGEGHGDDLAAPARNQKDIRAPALIRRGLLDLADVSVFRFPTLPAARRGSRTLWGPPATIVTDAISHREDSISTCRRGATTSST